MRTSATESRRFAPQSFPSRAERRPPVVESKTVSSPAEEAVPEETAETETFVADSRFFVSPAQVVEGRLAALTKESSILVSQLNKPTRGRYQ